MCAVAGYHPHGILCFGAFSLVFQRSSGFQRLFTRSKGMLVGVASALLHLPVAGTLCMMFGFVPVSRSSLQRACSTSHDLVIIPGGIAEVCAPQLPDEETLFLRRRSGFIKLALQTGRDLVPVFGFGESQTYHQLQFAQRIREAVSRRLGVVVALFYGRWLTLMPQNVPISVVVGSPICVGKPNPNPSEALVQDVLEAYIAEIERIFELHKRNVPGYEQRRLKII